jgi:hypothetical protein
MFRVFPWVALFFLGLFTQSSAEDSSSEELRRRMIERRAVEAAIWAMPAVNYDLMLQEMLTKTGGKVGEVIYWGRPLDSKNQTLTPNPDALYFMAFFSERAVARARPCDDRSAPLARHREGQAVQAG